MTSKTTAVANPDDDGGKQLSYANAAADSIEIVRENLGGGAIQVTDLPRVKFPSGGGIAWEIPTLDGFDSTKELTGVIVHQQPMRRYWATALDEGAGGAPPDCQSPDGEWGYGDPGGECATCPFNEFGSDSSGRGKACKESKGLFLLRQDEMLPTFVSVPATSLKPLRQYMLGLANHSARYYHVETALTLVKEQNKGGITYALLQPKLKRTLSDEEIHVIDSYRRELEPMLTQYATRAAASAAV